MRDKDFLMLQEAYGMIREGIEDQKRVGEQLKNAIRGHMPEFIGFDYTKKDGETSHYTLNVGIPYERIMELKVNKLNELKDHIPDELKAKITRVLGAKSQNGTLNLKKHEGFVMSPEAVDRIIAMAIHDLEVSQSVTMARGEQLSDDQKEADALFEPFTKGIKIHKGTGSVKLYGIIRSKKTISGKVERKESKSDPVVVAKNIISSTLPLYGTFTLEPHQLGSFRVSGNTLEISSEPEQEVEEPEENEGSEFSYSSSQPQVGYYQGQAYAVGDEHDPNL